MAGGDPSLCSLWSIEWSFALSNRLWRNTIPDRHRSLHVARDYLNRIWGGVPRSGQRRSFPMLLVGDRVVVCTEQASLMQHDSRPAQITARGFPKNAQIHADTYFFILFYLYYSLVSQVFFLVPYSHSV